VVELTMKTETSTTLRAFVIELVVHAVLVAGYVFLILQYLSGWLQQVHLSHFQGPR